jgi:hypothetical protein
MRRFLPLLIGALLLALVLPGAMSAKQANYSTPISGVTDVAGQTFTGTLDISKVAVRNGQLVALGTVTGTVTDLLGATVQTVNASVALPITVNAATCNILDLTLGPLDLNLLGLVVHLNQVHLVIDAQSGPGNLLGNLLCAIAGLLDGGGPLGQIANLLNQILAILQGLGL